jgi:hypothetical protein
MPTNNEFPFHDCNSCPGLRKTKAFQQIFFFCKLTVKTRILRKINCPAFNEEERKLFKNIWSPNKKPSKEKLLEVKKIPLMPQPSTSFQHGNFCKKTNTLCHHHKIIEKEPVCILIGKIRRPDLDLKPRHKKDKITKKYGNAKTTLTFNCPKNLTTQEKDEILNRNPHYRSTQ